MQQTAGGEQNPVDCHGLCLLSLDGGGVRGLSTLFILKGIMARLNHERKEAGLPAAKPCEIFDLIGGTSTGGLIAIMLGRLEMDVDVCISIYVDLIKGVFEKKSSWLPVSLRGNVKAQFDSKKLRSAVEQAIERSGASPTDRFNDGQSRGCRVFVCAATKETSETTRLRSYDLPGKMNIEATILDAALATSAATGFFDPVSIGARQFVDGALGANNPIEQVEREASDIWCADTAELMPQVKCILSLGTGHPGKKAIEENVLKFLSKTLVQMATETERTETSFSARWRQHYDRKRYFRFNVDHGLESVGLEEYDQQGTIEAATESYLDHIAQVAHVRDCVLNLTQKQNKTPTTFASIIHEYHSSLLSRQTSSREPCWTVPFQRNTRFVGRMSLLEKLDAVLFTNNQSSKVSLFGLGGVGKTQVALELAYRTRARYPGCAVIWIPTNNIERLQQAYLDAAETLGIAVTDNKTDVKRLVQRHLSHDSVGRWLVVYDNADDLDMWVPRNGSHDDLHGLLEYVPRSNQGCVVFTTRSRKIALRLSPDGLREEVSQMNDSAALQLLFGRLNQDVPERHEEGETLIEQLCHLPLAIVQAAAYIDANQSSFREYLDLLSEQEEDVVKLLSEEFADEGSYHTVKDPVATTWLISFQHMRQSDSLAVEYLSLMSCFDPKDIPQSLLPPRESRKEEVDAIGTLMAYAFITRQPATTFLDMHRLVHLATRSWLRQEDRFNIWAEKAVTRLDEVLPNNADHANSYVWRPYLPHARYSLSSYLPEQLGTRNISLFTKFAMSTLSDGRYDEAEECFLCVWQIHERVLGAKHPSTLTFMANLASTYRKQGRYKEAESIEVQVLEDRKRVLGAEHPDTLISMSNLAWTYLEQKAWKKAENIEVQVLEARKRLLGAEHRHTLFSMCNLASAIRNQGRYAEAEVLQTEELEICKRVLGAMHPDTLLSLSNLASTYTENGRLREAEGITVEVLEAHKTLLGDKHPETLSSMADLVVTFVRQCRWEEAYDLGMQVLETRVEVLGAEHPNTLTSMNNLSSILLEQKHWKAAENLMAQVIEIQRRVLGPDHPDTLTSMANLVCIYQEQERWKDAADIQVQVVECRKRVLGPQHSDTLASMETLALAYKTLKRLGDAKDLMVQVADTRGRVLGKKHVETQRSLDAVATLKQFMS